MLTELLKTSEGGKRQLSTAAEHEKCEKMRGTGK